MAEQMMEKMMLKKSYSNGNQDAQKARNIQNKYQAQSSAINSFVKKAQDDAAKHGGKEPSLKAEYQNLDASMCVNGEKAQEFARKLTAGLDKDAFPVR